jgi:hypothetical protein
MVQPNPLDDMAAAAEVQADELREEQEERPEYTGDMPDDPEEAEHYRPGQDR